MLLARFNTKGNYSTAHRRLDMLFWLSVGRWASSWVSDKVRNNWVDDDYDWAKEIVFVTGGAGGIGGAIVKLLEEKGVTVVVLDVQPMSFQVCTWSPSYTADTWLNSPGRPTDHWLRQLPESTTLSAMFDGLREWKKWPRKSGPASGIPQC